MTPDKTINSSKEDKIIEFEFPRDLAKKGNEMMDCYYNLFILENFLRIFIEKVAQNIFGFNYWNKLKINEKIQKDINYRKKQEEKNAWLSLRDKSELFYIDFKHLGTIIADNSYLFKDLIPSENWITSKIEDLSKLRNRVAHHSYIDKSNQDYLKSITNTIYSQLASTLKYEYQRDFIIKEEKPISNRFSEFQNLIYTKNYKSIFDQWNKFRFLFINPIFSISDVFNQYRGFIFINYKLANKTLKLNYEGSYFSCEIENKNRETIDDTEDNFIKKVKNFFEDIIDSVNMET